MVISLIWVVSVISIFKIGYISDIFKAWVNAGYIIIYHDIVNDRMKPFNQEEVSS